MKVAARFPIKPFKPLYWGIIVLYTLCAVLAVFSMQAIVLLGVYPVLAISIFYTLRHYRRLTSAPDDLCWNGDSWLIKDSQQLTVYLELQNDSWISRQATLLHFKARPALLGVDPNLTQSREFYWLFTLSHLGERSYRELCYLVKQNVKHQVN
jgi:hypothetical protein